MPLKLCRMDLKNMPFLFVIPIVFLACGGSDDNGETPLPPPVVIESCEALVENATPTGDNMTLVWADEFTTDGSPCTDNWNYDLGDGCPNLCGWGNGEAQYYTNRSENVIAQDGILKIIVKKENYQGSTYTSARLKTQGKFSFLYGKVEVRAKLPVGGGTWPAIWTLGSNITSVGWPACGEIDIMEHRGNNPGYTSSALHTPSSFGGTINVHEELTQNVSSQFHVYALEWTEEKIDFYIDEQLHYTYNPSTKNDNTWPFYREQFILLNVAMGGSFGGAIDANFAESSMEIDYVRVYQ